MPPYHNRRTFRSVTANFFSPFSRFTMNNPSTSRTPVKTKWGYGLAADTKRETIIYYYIGSDDRKLRVMKLENSNPSTKFYRCCTCRAAGEVKNDKLYVDGHATECKPLDGKAFWEEQNELKAEKDAKPEPEVVTLSDTTDDEDEDEVIEIHEEEPQAKDPSPSTSKTPPSVANVDPSNVENIPPDAAHDVSMEMANLGVQDSAPRLSWAHVTKNGVAKPNPDPPTSNRNNKRPHEPSLTPPPVAPVLRNVAPVAPQPPAPVPGPSQPNQRRSGQGEAVEKKRTYFWTWMDPRFQYEQCAVDAMNGPPNAKKARNYGPKIPDPCKYVTPNAKVQKIWRAAFNLNVFLYPVYPQATIENLVKIAIKRVEEAKAAEAKAAEAKAAKAKAAEAKSEECKPPRKVHVTGIYHAISKFVLGSENYWPKIYEFLYEAISTEQIETKFYNAFDTAVEDAKDKLKKIPNEGAKVNHRLIFSALGALFRCQVFVYDKKGWHQMVQYVTKVEEKANQKFPDDRPCIAFLYTDNFFISLLGLE